MLARLSSTALAALKTGGPHWHTVIHDVVSEIYGVPLLSLGGVQYVSIDRNCFGAVWSAYLFPVDGAVMHLTRWVNPNNCVSVRAIHTKIIDSPALRMYGDLHLRIREYEWPSS